MTAAATVHSFSVGMKFPGVETCGRRRGGHRVLQNGTVPSSPPAGKTLEASHQGTMSMKVTGDLPGKSVQDCRDCVLDNLIITAIKIMVGGLQVINFLVLGELTEDSPAHQIHCCDTPMLHA